MGFQKIETAIPDLLLIKPDVFGDSRGFFMELFNRKSFDSLGLSHLDFVQDNLSYSKKGTMRGLHFQANPHAQGKLVTVFKGSVYDVGVDIRKNSPTYGQYVGVEIHAEDPMLVYIPAGFAHGFQVLSDDCLFFYKCTNYYHKASEGGLAWDDPKLQIEWRDISPIISDKDLNNPILDNFNSPFD